MNEVIRIALQKSGRLSEESLKLIKECGIKFTNGTGKLKSSASNFPIEFLFLRDDDIPGYVADGVADIGIVGENVAVEKNKDVKIAKKLGFSKCRLSLAIPKGKEYLGILDFNGKSVATSYPKILKDFFDKNGIHADIHEISGSVEIAPGIGLADAICDIVSSGSTLLSNGLKEVEVIFNSESVLISSTRLSVQRGKNNKYILLNAPNDKLEGIMRVLPGMRSPSILPLAQKGWSSLHSVINEDDFWEVIENLKEMGAEGILVVPIEKMII
jgi:ATP phosphoribosyltransferase